MINISKNILIFIKHIFGSLFKSSFYRSALNFKLSKVLLIYFFLLLLAYLIPFFSIFNKITSIDLINPENLISKKVNHWIDQLPSFNIKDGKIELQEEEKIEVMQYESNESVIVFNTKEQSQKEGAVFFTSDGLYFHDANVSAVISDLFEIPQNNFLYSSSKKDYSFVSYDNFENIDITSDFVRSVVTEIVGKYDHKYYLIVSLYFVFVNFIILLVQITIFTFLTISILGSNKLKYYKIYILTACAFIPYFILEIINILTFKQSYLLNSYPSSFIIFLLVNCYFVRFAAKSISNIKS